MSKFSDGFQDELQKLGSVATAIGSVAVGKLTANAIVHAIVNTKASPKVLRRLVDTAGDDLTAAGFRHALMGKKIKAIPQAIIGTAITPSAPYLYNSGYRYGKKVHDAMKRVPGAKSDAPFKAIRSADRGVTKALDKAPMAGAAYGGYQGYTGTKDPTLSGVASGAIAGALIGKGIKHYGPSAPGPKQLKWIRSRVVDPVMSGSQSRLGRALDIIATKTKG